jgi:hypothetical protein
MGGEGDEGALEDANRVDGDVGGQGGDAEATASFGPGAPNGSSVSATATGGIVA